MLRMRKLRRITKAGTAEDRLTALHSKRGTTTKKRIYLPASSAIVAYVVEVTLTMSESTARLLEYGQFLSENIEV